MLLLNGLQDIAPLVLRLFLAAIFIYHGLPKIKGGKQMAQAMGKPQMGIFMVLLGTAETLGGIAAAVGFLTQIAAAGFIIVMLGAIYMKATLWKTGFTSQKTTGWEFDFMILGAAIALLLLGAGTISVDASLGLFP